jgi:sulfide:quinone oxidoreductase
MALTKENNCFDIVIVGGGAAGGGVAASLLKRNHALNIAIIEPSDMHYYQPAWTLVGGGAFDIVDSVRPMADCLPKKATWIRAAVTAFDPTKNAVHTDIAGSFSYEQLIVAAGLKLNWDAIPGLSETLGKNGVTSNYRFDLAPYTWQLTQNLASGKAIFTQPPMPIKCAGAPQKAMYLSCSAWEKSGVLNRITVEFNNAGAVLFGVATFVPILMAYVKRYNAKLCFNSTLIAVDGAAKKAWFNVKDAEGNVTKVEKTFDVLHVVPPQSPLDFIKNSPLATVDGWVDVNQATLQHNKFGNIFSLGDACSSPNAKTVAAVRQQIVVVAENLLAIRANTPIASAYYGYGGCPLTVENGKIVLAEFGYGGTLLPTFPFMNAFVPSRLFWHLKKRVLPWVYWNGMLKGREWLARPTAPMPAKAVEVK